MISFVVCSIDAAKFASLERNLAACCRSGAYEIVGIHDAPSLGAGWTRGLARATADRIVFCHDDIEFFTPDLVAAVTRHLARFDIVGLAGTQRCVGMDWSEAGIEHAYGAIVHDAGSQPQFCFYGAGGDDAAVGAIEAMDGVFLAMRRGVAEAVGFDAITFDGWHGYDADFTYRSHLAGYRLAVALDLPVVHRSRGRPDAARMRYHLRFADKHAARLPVERGPWVDVKTSIAIPDGIGEAFSAANLARLHDWTRDEATRRRMSAERPYASSRNAPCPCGSGLRYRECHGALR